MHKRELVQSIQWPYRTFHCSFVVYKYKLRMVKEASGGFLLASTRAKVNKLKYHTMSTPAT
jgi:hypothetical protein